MESNIELEISQLNAELLRLKSEIVSFENTRKSEVQMLKERVTDAGSVLGSKNSISQIEGRRYPKWYSVEIPFSYGGSTPKSSSVEITTRPFVCTQMSSLYYITDEDPSHFAGVGSFSPPYSTSEITCDGRSLPTTAYFATITSMLYDWNVRKMSKPSVNIIEYSSFVIGKCLVIITMVRTIFGMLVGTIPTLTLRLGLRTQVDDGLMIRSLQLRSIVRTVTLCF